MLCERPKRRGPECCPNWNGTSREERKVGEPKVGRREKHHSTFRRYVIGGEGDQGTCVVGSVAGLQSEVGAWSGS